MKNSSFRSKKIRIYPLFLLFSLLQFCPLLAQKKERLQPISFASSIEKREWLEAEKEIEQMQKKDPQKATVFLLQLAYAYGNADLQQKALSLLESHWKQLESQKMTPFAYILKARLLWDSSPSEAWRYFEQAESLLPREHWPPSDARFYSKIEKEQREEFEQQLQIIERLVEGGLWQEALGSIEKIDRRLEEGFYPFGEGRHILQRSLCLKRAQLLQENKRAKEALTVLDGWPPASPCDRRGSPQSIQMQELQRGYLRGITLLDLEENASALQELGLTYQEARQERSAELLLHTSLAFAQALHKNNKTEEALDLLEGATAFVSLFPLPNRPTAQLLLTEKKAKLLLEIGRLPQALATIERQKELPNDPKSRGALLLLKKELLERLPNKDSSWLEICLELLSLPVDSQDSSSQDSFSQASSSQASFSQAVEASILELLQNIDRFPLLQKKLLQLLLDPPEMTPEIQVRCSEWMLQHRFLSSLEMKPLRKRLLAIEKGPWQPLALYLACQIGEGKGEKERLFRKILELEETLPPLRSLVSAQLERLSPLAPCLKLQKILDLADTTTGSTRESLLALALDLAIEERVVESPALEALSIDPGALPSPSALLYQEWRILSPLEKKEEAKALAVLKKGAERIDLWGLRACRTYANLLLRRGFFEEGRQALLDWRSSATAFPHLERRALMEISALYYKQNLMAQTRTLLAEIVERWPDFPEKPWLELRFYSEQEYLQASPQSQQSLKRIQENYPKHPARSVAAFLEARSIEGKGQPLERLQAWEKVLGTVLSLWDSEDPIILDTYLRALIEKARCLESLGFQKEAAASLERSPSLPKKYSEPLRLEAACLKLASDQLAKGQEELEQLWQESTPASKWQIEAALELAQSRLENKQPLLCIEILEKIVCVEELQVQERLLLAARAHREQGEKELSEIYLRDLLERPSATDRQKEALWYIYLWNREGDSKRAEKALRACKARSSSLCEGVFSTPPRRRMRS